MNPPNHMHTNPPNPYIDFTTLHAYLFSEDGRITTHSQGLLLGRRICSMIDRGARVKVVLNGVSTFRGPAVHALLAEVFSTFGVDHANKNLVFTADSMPEYARRFALHLMEAAASFRENEQGMEPQPEDREASYPNGEPGVISILPRQPEALAAEEPKPAPKLARPLPANGVAPCPACARPDSVSRHNANWTCYKCGFTEAVDEDREESDTSKPIRVESVSGNYIWLEEELAAALDSGRRVELAFTEKEPPTVSGLMRMFSNLAKQFGPDRVSDQMRFVYPGGTVNRFIDQVAHVYLSALRQVREEQAHNLGAPVINFGVRPGVASVKPEIAKALADASKRPGNYIDGIQAAREKRLAEEAAKAPHIKAEKSRKPTLAENWYGSADGKERPRIRAEKSQEPITYEVDLDEKERVRERREFERWASGICANASDTLASAAAWTAWQMRAAIRRSEVEYWVARTKGARRDKWIALVWAGIFWAGLCAVVFWRK